MIKSLHVKTLWVFAFFLMSVMASAFTKPVPTGSAQTVSGKVTDEAGDPMPGVNILLKGTNTGTSTDINGKYSIEVPSEDAVLVFSFIGYTTEEVTVGSRSVIDISMMTDIQSLSEIVLVGYGQQDRAEVTSAITTVGRSKFDKVTITSIDQVLAGQAAGVVVKQATGTPGGGATISIRGGGSLSASSDPLYVIDGFVIADGYDKYNSPLSRINPDDIESINILKDASATAIYGSRGANGVIIITTKKAKAGASSVEFSAYTGVQNVIKKQIPEMMTAEEFARFRVEYRMDSAAFAGVPYDASKTPAAYANPESLGKGTNWIDELTQTAPIQNYNVTLRNGTGNTRVLVSGSYMGQDGIVIGSNFSRYSLRANIETDIGQRFKAGVNLAPSFSDRKLLNSEGHFNNAILTQALLNSPLPPVRQADGSFTPSISSPGTFSNANPVNQALHAAERIKNVRALMNSFVSVELIKGLTFKSSFNVDFNFADSKIFNRSTVGNFRNPPPVQATGVYRRDYSIDWLSENTLTYIKTINEDHKLDVLLGYTTQKDHWERIQLNGSQYANEKITSPTGATTVTRDGSDIQEWSLISYLGRVIYSYKDKYLLNAAVRRDGSSRFGPNNRWAMFPSASVGWRISQESFFPQLPALSELKLRLSYGLAGTNQIGNYQYLPTIGTDNYVLGSGLADGRKLDRFSNYELGWEESRSFNGGFDAILFDGKLNLVVDYYSKVTQKMLLTVDMPYSSGFQNLLTNLGEIKNHGVEITLSAKPVNTGKLRWESDFNISFNRNKVTDLAGLPFIKYDISNITLKNKPLGMFYGYKFLGLYQSQEEINSYIPNSSGFTPGTVKYEDYSHDGNTTAADMQVIGSPHPNFTYGFNNRIYYGKFDISILLNGSQGGQIFDLYKRFTYNVDGVFNVSKDIENRYRETGEPGNGKIASAVNKTSLFRDVNSSWVVNGSYAVLRNVNLGYNMKLQGLSNLRVYASVQNALYFTSYKGNPEISQNGSNVLGPGVNYTGYPVARMFTVGFNATF